MEVLYANKPETPVYADNLKKVVNKVLLGTWLGVIQKKDGWVKVITAGPDGWVNEDDTQPSSGLKIFFVDVGQGDGCLIEAPGCRFLVDGGPRPNLYHYLRKWQYSYLLNNNDKIVFDAVFVSHFDADHYVGLIPILNDERFKFSRIYHNGIARFHGKKNKRPQGYDTDLGATSGSGEDRLLKTTFSTLADAHRLKDQGGLQSTFERFLDACFKAERERRLTDMKRLTANSKDLNNLTDKTKKLSFQVLAPVPHSRTGRVRFQWFDDSSHTRNGHSIVLKIQYDQRTFLLGGDLNSQSENYIQAHHSEEPDVFEVDVAKSCHHGSSDFTVAFMKALKPYATVISSGDNESYAHPRADAIGCAGRYSKGKRPLVFSTELARSISSSQDILYGMINLRSDGDRIVLAQMKESKRGADVWDSYKI